MTTQRLGNASRVLYYPEGAGTWNADTGITVGYILPLAAQSGYGDSDTLIDAPIFDGTALPFDAINGLIQAGGDLSLGMEYETAGVLWKDFLGPNGYARPGAGTNTLHEFFIPIIAGSVPGSGQIQSEFLESPAQYIRGRGNRIGGFKYQTNVQGVAQYAVSFLGSGSMVQTDLAGTKTDNGYAASNYFNGQISYTSAGVTTVLADVASLAFNPMRKAGRQEVAFNGGVAGSVNLGNVNAGVDLEILMGVGGSGPAANLAYYNDAVNQNVIQIDFLWANGPLATCTKYKRVTLTALRMSRTAPKPGGEDGIVYKQTAKMVRNSGVAKTAAEYMFPTLGPYAVTAATNDKLGLKIDGAGTITVSLTAGAARTAAQIVTDINANASIPAVAVADVFCGRVRVTSRTSGSASSVQVDTAVAQTGHALFGADNVARTGRDNCPMLIRVFNARSSNYP